jgi:ATP-dependent exoDNAse (exonuclease V) alpha subunit
VTYDPRRLHGVALYREADRAIAVGDRVQFTAPNRAHRVANRELATLERVDVGGRLHLRLESGRTIAVASHAHPHLDYGYAVTSHSAQGQTADRVIVHVDWPERRARKSPPRLRGRFSGTIRRADLHG